MTKRILISPDFIRYADIKYLKNSISKEYKDIEIKTVSEELISDIELDSIYFSTHLLFSDSIEEIKDLENGNRYTKFGPFVILVKIENDSIFYLPDGNAICLLKILSISDTVLEHKFIINNIQ